MAPIWQQHAYRRRVVAVLAQCQPGGTEAHELAAHVLMLGDETADDIRVGGRAHPDSFFFSSSLSCAGLALPPVAFMTWPTKKPKSLSLPER